MILLFITCLVLATGFKIFVKVLHSSNGQMVYYTMFLREQAKQSIKMHHSNRLTTTLESKLNEIDGDWNSHKIPML